MTGSYSYGDSKMEFTYEDDGKKVTILYTYQFIDMLYYYNFLRPVAGLSSTVGSTSPFNLKAPFCNTLIE